MEQNITNQPTNKQTSAVEIGYNAQRVTKAICTQKIKIHCMSNFSKEKLIQVQKYRRYSRKNFIAEFYCSSSITIILLELQFKTKIFREILNSKKHFQILREESCISSKCQSVSSISAASKVVLTKCITLSILRLYPDLLNITLPYNLTTVSSTLTSQIDTRSSHAQNQIIARTHAQTKQIEVKSTNNHGYIITSLVQLNITFSNTTQQVNIEGMIIDAILAPGLNLVLKN
eukprot:TRINITY_DN2495_c0_g2_i1.p1 TRINITY_DN2495_c0_g2~~TRINITY_DN2495_c0_g2_i1.p1  ORF type:complete len:231 (+),score=-9.64 TRINITY_DN2495_c0_g2_i1:345-1037(+)